MTLEQSNLMDMVNLDHASGLCSLIIVDHLPWDDDHLPSLQAKINSCLRYIESGKIHVAYPAAHTCDFVLVIQFIYAPTCAARAFLARAQEIVEDAGYLLSFGPLGSAYADSSA